VSKICEPTEHDFYLGGEGNGGAKPDWEAWLFCSKCGAIGMVPSDASKGLVIVASEKDGQGT
jgi:hypothetical protein